jgi:ABC-2 type transport system permease protein
VDKILLIIRREYLTRVRKRSFIVMSVLGPILFGLMFVIPIWLASREGDEKVIEVLDESGYFKDRMQQLGNIRFEHIDFSVAEAKQRVGNDSKYGLLYVPAFDLEQEAPPGITFFGPNNPSIEVQSELERFLKREIEDLKLERSGIDKERLDKIKTRIRINTINLTEEGEREGDTGIATAVGYFASLLIYFFIFLYGVQTVRAVVEEKSNRIVEVIISSVKPFQLMMGKIIGIGAVGLTQFILWVLLTGLIYAGAQSYFNIDAPPQQVGMMSPQTMADTNADAQAIFEKIGTINFPFIIGVFIFYFLGAYLFYGSLFAAVGSAVDNDSDAQQFQLPITLPLIFSIIILAAILREPNGSLAFWTSMVPFTSPVVMMMRIPFDPPAWQIALSMALLVIGFIATTWLAGRIYRIGILMHGSKVNYRILWKWLIMKH